nr:hypothetical protein [Brachyspira aalborgi]
MNIFCFTNKGANSKINTDTILFNSEAISGNPFNNKLITNDYKTNGAYIIMPNSLEPSQQFSNRYNFNQYYYVKDNIFDINNWKKFQINWKTKESKEIKLN